MAGCLNLLIDYGSINGFSVRNIMSITFSDAPSFPSVRCEICYDPLDKEVVGHDNMHFLHKKCIEAWAKYHNSCPFCRRTIAYDYREDDEETDLLASLIGLSGGPLVAGLLCQMTVELICMANGRPQRHMQSTVVHGIAGVVGVTTRKLICKLCAPQSEISTQIRSWPSAAISVIVPFFVAYKTAQYYGRC